VDPAHPVLPDITSYLTHLFHKGLAVQTIMGHRAMLSSALKFHTELDLTNSKELANLIVSFKQERPPQRSMVPKWDLDLVLYTLMEKPFEPVWDEAKVPLTYLTWKVTFLLLLASGLRRGELHNIPFKGITYQKDFDWVTIRPNPSFINKTRVATGLALLPFKIESFKHLVGHEQERKLDPCRAISAYLKRTEGLRGNRKLFLISPDPRVRDEISANTISAWISNLIQFVYAQPGQRAIQLTGRTTHEVRAYAASLVHKGCWALEDILQSGQWKSHQVFVEHYLRDLSEQQDNLSRLGPISAGRQTVRL
jgi:hypothetical protein